jgi:hypothetical protein
VWVLLGEIPRSTCETEVERQSDLARLTSELQVGPLVKYQLAENYFADGTNSRSETVGITTCLADVQLRVLGTASERVSRLRAASAAGAMKYRSPIPPKEYAATAMQTLASASPTATSLRSCSFLRKIRKDSKTASEMSDGPTQPDHQNAPAPLHIRRILPVRPDVAR